MVDWKIFDVRELVTIEKLMNDENLEVKILDEYDYGNPLVEVRIKDTDFSIEFAFNPDKGTLLMDIPYRVTNANGEVLIYLLHRYGLLFYNDMDVDLQEVYSVINNCKKFLTYEEFIGYLIYSFGTCTRKYVEDEWLDKLLNDTMDYYAYAKSVLQNWRMNNACDKYEDVPECCM